MNVSSVKNLNGETFSAVQDTFLTNIVSSNSANWNEISAYQANSGNFLTAVPDTYLQNTDLSTEDGKVTAISGVPLAAGGGDVPEGVMAESGLEFNAVDEISGYNGSAFAQYGAEKQWLVHDDTIVHVSNSAQYAFGVNLSAVERLLGIDETVLYNNTAATTGDLPIGSTFNISEPITNFNRVNIQFSRFALNTNRPCTQSVVLDTTAAIPTILLHTTFSTTDTGDGGWFGLSMLISGTSGTTWKMAKCYQNTLPAGALDQGWCYLKPYKIVGIGRKQ